MAFPLGTTGRQAAYRQATLSPDEKWLAAQIRDPPPDPASNVWLVNLATGVMSRLTSNGSKNGVIWSPDGREVMYTSMTGPPALYRRPAGGGEERMGRDAPSSG